MRVATGKKPAFQRPSRQKARGKRADGSGISFEESREFHKKMFGRRYDGPFKAMTIRRCECMRLHYSKRDEQVVRKGGTARQMDLARLCPMCFFEKHGDHKPNAYQFLSEEEVDGWEGYYKATGCKIYKVDPSTL